MTLLALIDHESGDFSQWDGQPSGNWIYSASHPTEYASSQAAFTLTSPTNADEDAQSYALYYDGRANPSGVDRPLWGPRRVFPTTGGLLYVSFRATVLSEVHNGVNWIGPAAGLHFLDDTRSINASHTYSSVDPYTSRGQYFAGVRIVEPGKWAFHNNNANWQSGAGDETGMTDWMPPYGWFWDIAPDQHGGILDAYYDFGEWATCHFSVFVGPNYGPESTDDKGSTVTLYKAEADDCSDTASVDTKSITSFGGVKQAFAAVAMAGHGAEMEIDNIVITNDTPTCPEEWFGPEGWGWLI